MPKHKSIFPPFTGKLASPIEIEPAIPPSLFSEEYEIWEKNYAREELAIINTAAIDKLPLLFTHYNIEQNDPNAMTNLAIILACEYVPGFRVKRPKKRGRKTVWKDAILGQLWYEVYEYNKEKNMSASSICNILSKKEPWKSYLEKGRSVGGEGAVETLYKRYQDAEKSSFVKFITGVVKLPNLKSTPDIYIQEWFSILRR